MRVLRSATAIDPLSFGRRPVPEPEGFEAQASDVGGDLRLFANTFAIGFLFVAVFIF
jgi:hypothetical protein